MKDTISELWHGNIYPQSDSRNNTPAMKELMEYLVQFCFDWSFILAPKRTFVLIGKSAFFTFLFFEKTTDKINTS